MKNIGKVGGTLGNLTGMAAQVKMTSGRKYWKMLELNNVGSGKPGLEDKFTKEL